MNAIHKTGFAAVGSAAAFMAIRALLGQGWAIKFVPFLFLIPVLVYLQYQKKAFPFSAERILNESPSAIGMMAVGIRSGDSFDTVVRNVAEKGPSAIASLFREVVLDVDCRNCDSVSGGISRLLSKMPKAAQPFRRAVHMLISASETADQAERESMVSDAEKTALNGLKEMGETYGAGLNTPCMVVFGLGIMVPMVLVSILPMIMVGGAMGSGKIIDPVMISIITLVAIPLIIAATILSVRSKNPFASVSKDLGKWKPAFAFLAAIPSFAFLRMNGMDVQTSVFVSMMVSSVAALGITVPSVIEERKRQAVADALSDLLFEVGNRLVAGDNFESALTSALGTKKECAGLCVEVEREFLLSRGNSGDAVRNAISPYSKELADTYARIMIASERNPRDAGRLAVSMARQMQDQESVRTKISNKLKSMLDMMAGTAMVFAPMVLGLSVAMMKPLSRIADIGFASGVSVILTAYLVELSVLMVAMSAALSSKGSPSEWVMRLGLTVPAALIVFRVCSGISL